MAITIRNKETERMIREIGRKTGEGPSAVIRRAVESLREPERQETEDERIARRMKAWDELNKEFPPPDRQAAVERGRTRDGRAV